MSQRAVSTLAMSPQHYDKPKGHFWQGTSTMERFDPTYPAKEEVFEEYLANKSMSPSRHVATLSKSSGLLELHYETMRKKQLSQVALGAVQVGPSMGRSYEACTGYSGHIPGKLAGNIVGTTFANSSQLARETRGQFFDPPHSGMTYTITNRGGMSSSQSLPSLKPPSRGTDNPLSPAKRRSSIDRP